MANTTVTANAPSPKRRFGWLKILIWALASCLLLLIVVFFVATSAAFLKGFILPRVSKSLNAQVTVTDASISPFRQVILHNLKVQTTGTEPLLSASEVRLRYGLFDIIGGNIKVDEVTVLSPKILLVENPDGSSNLDPILKANKQETAAKPGKGSEPAKPSKPLKVDIKQVQITDADIRRLKLYKG